MTDKLHLIYCFVDRHRLGNMELTADRHRRIPYLDFNRFTGAKISRHCLIGAVRRFQCKSGSSSALRVTAGSSAIPRSTGLHCCSRGDGPAPVTGTAQPQWQFIKGQIKRTVFIAAGCLRAYNRPSGGHGYFHTFCCICLAWIAFMRNYDRHTLRIRAVTRFILLSITSRNLCLSEFDVRSLQFPCEPPRFER